MQLSDRTILITGASTGIGAAAARAFAEYPVRLALLARSAAPLHALAEELNTRAGVQALAAPADVSQPEQVAAAMTAITQTLGPVDILVNNAGVGMRSPVGSIDRSAALALFATNFWGALTCTESVLPAMRQRRDGLIINISSILGRRAMPNAGIYCASKFALNAFSEALRLEVHADHIRVVSFYPGVTATGFTRHELTGDAAAYNRNRVPKTPASVVGRAIVRAAQREPRDAYATLFDRAFVWASTLTPWLLDFLLSRWYRPADA